MPKVAEFDGIKIRFYPDERPPPHFHAIYGEFAAQIRIRPIRLLGGSLPHAKLRIVLAWTERNERALARAWDDMAAGRKPGRIP